MRSSDDAASGGGGVLLVVMQTEEEQDENASQGYSSHPDHHGVSYRDSIFNISSDKSCGGMSQSEARQGMIWAHRGEWGCIKM
jgi:hypothetical protein